jgi:hypothetical protein
MNKHNNRGNSNYKCYNPRRYINNSQNILVFLYRLLLTTQSIPKKAGQQSPAPSKSSFFIINLIIKNSKDSLKPKSDC